MLLAIWHSVPRPVRSSRCLVWSEALKLQRILSGHTLSKQVDGDQVCTCVRTRVRVYMRACSVLPTFDVLCFVNYPLLNPDFLPSSFFPDLSPPLVEITILITRLEMDYYLLFFIIWCKYIFEKETCQLLYIHEAQCFKFIEI